jgi:hypothetical protein
MVDKHDLTILIVDENNLPISEENHIGGISLEPAASPLTEIKN